MKTIDKLKEKLDAVEVRGTGTSYLDAATKEHFKALCEIIDELTADVDHILNVKKMVSTSGTAKPSADNDVHFLRR